MKRRGQVALEFIMTYGWAILIVLVAIGALAYFGVLNPARFLPDKCIFSTGVACQDFIIQESGGNMEVRFTIANNLGNGMVIDAANLTISYKGGTGTACTIDTPPGGTQVTIPAGEAQGFTCASGVASPGVGQSVKFKMELDYSLVQGVYLKHAEGEISSTVQ